MRERASKSKRGREKERQQTSGGHTYAAVGWRGKEKQRGRAAGGMVRLRERGESSGSDGEIDKNLKKVNKMTKPCGNMASAEAQWLKSRHGLNHITIHSH